MQDNWKACELTVIYKPGYKCENPLTNSLIAYKFMRSVWNPELLTLQSHFMAFFLDPKGRTIAYRPITTGSMGFTPIDIKLICCLALQTLASSVMTAISRPSASLKASASGLENAKKLKLCLSLFDIKLLDHLIIADNSYLSLHDKDLI